MLRKILWIGILYTLAACAPETQMPQETDPTKSSGSQQINQMNVLSFAMYAEPVFANDVLTFSKALRSTKPRIASEHKFGWVGSGLIRPSESGLNSAIAKVAATNDDADDLAIVFLTTHGNKGILAQKPSGARRAHAVSADQIKAFLKPLENDHHLVIIQACYSGSLINSLKHPNRALITAAAKDRTSFGCQPDAQNTWFTKALNSEIKKGGSWASIAKRTQATVLKYETKKRIRPNRRSNPQIYVGKNMQGFWTSTL